MCETNKNVCENNSVAIQGFGNAGHHLAEFLHDAGHRILALSDSKGAIVSKTALNPTDVYNYKNVNSLIILQCISIIDYRICFALIRIDLVILAAKI